MSYKVVVEPNNYLGTSVTLSLAGDFFITNYPNTPPILEPM